MNEAETSPNTTQSAWSVLKQVTVYTFLGAVIAAIVAVLFVVVPKPSPGLGRGWGLLVAPVFAGIAAVPGAMIGFVVGVIRAASKR
jgi:branched-subunit amino acid ABC-type transport system permease component